MINAPVWYISFVWHIVFLFSQCLQLCFDVPSGIFKFKHFNCSNSFVPFSFIKLGPLAVIKLVHSLTCRNRVMYTTKCIPQINLFQHNMTIPLSLLIYFDFASFLSHFKAFYDTHPFSYFMSNFIISTFIVND